MKRKFLMRSLAIIFAFVISASLGYAQPFKVTDTVSDGTTYVPPPSRINKTDADSAVKAKRKERSDSLKKIQLGPKDLDKGNRQKALDPLLGYNEGHANTIIRLYEHNTVVAHEPYPDIRKVIAMTNVMRWGYPVTLYFFVDSAFTIVRMNYVFGTPDGLPPDSAHAILQNLHNVNEPMDFVSDDEWETAGWQKDRVVSLYTYQKGIERPMPSYIITLKSYMDEHLLPYVKEHGWPKDGIFTVIKE